MDDKKGQKNHDFGNTMLVKLNHKQAITLISLWCLMLFYINIRIYWKYSNQKKFLSLKKMVKDLLIVNMLLGTLNTIIIPFETNLMSLNSFILLITIIYCNMVFLVDAARILKQYTEEIAQEYYFKTIHRHSKFSVEQEMKGTVPIFPYCIWIAMNICILRVITRFDILWVYAYVVIAAITFEITFFFIGLLSYIIDHKNTTNPVNRFNRFTRFTQFTLSDDMMKTYIQRIKTCQNISTIMMEISVLMVTWILTFMAILINLLYFQQNFVICCINVFLTYSVSAITPTVFLAIY